MPSLSDSLLECGRMRDSMPHSSSSSSSSSSTDAACSEPGRSEASMELHHVNDYVYNVEGTWNVWNVRRSRRRDRLKCYHFFCFVRDFTLF